LRSSAEGRELYGGACSVDIDRELAGLDAGADGLRAAVPVGAQQLIFICHLKQSVLVGAKLSRDPAKAL
jgi:hypothetical protein